MGTVRRERGRVLHLIEDREEMFEVLKNFALKCYPSGELCTGR